MNTAENNKTILNPFTIIFYIFKYALEGIACFMGVFLEIIVYSFKGLYYLIISLPQDIYYIASGGVDKAYKTTKSVVTSVAEKKETEVKKDRISPKKRAQLEEERKILAELLASEEAKRVSKAAVYQYIAEDADGKLITGTFTGYSFLDVNSYLINEGFTVYSIKTSKLINFMYGESSIVPQKMSNKDLIFWLSQLSTYIKAGIPLTDSVRLIANSMKKNSRQKKIYERLVYELSMGEAFSKSLEKQGTIFPGLLINMLKAAEATGELAQTLEEMADYYTEIEKTRKQVISAMTYPTIVMVFALGVIIFIMLYVVPQFIEVYNSVGIELNGITKAVIGISLFLKDNIAMILLVLVIVIVAFVFTFKRVKAFRKGVQRVLMRVPVIGKIMIYKEITIFTKTFASLLKNNVFITDSIDILSKITNNEVYKDIMFQTISNIAKGDKISMAFKDHWAVPEVAYHMILTGESTGELPTMMMRVSDYFQEMNRNAVNTLKSFIEPIMIIFLTVIVGVVILSVIIPMFGLYEQIQM